MTPDSALPELLGRLEAAGFDVDRPELPVLWRVFRQWAAVPVEGMDPEEDADMLLFESALSLAAPTKYTPGPSFELDLVRQFSYEDEHGTYAGMSQLRAALLYPVHDDFHAVSRAVDWSDEHRPADQVWGAGGPHADQWASEVEATASFRAALGHAPTRAHVAHTPV